MDFSFPKNLKFQFNDDLRNRDGRQLVEIWWAASRTTAVLGKEAILPSTAPQADPAWGWKTSSPSGRSPDCRCLIPAVLHWFGGCSTQEKRGHRGPELGHVRAPNQCSEQLLSQNTLTTNANTALSLNF